MGYGDRLPYGGSGGERWVGGSHLERLTKAAKYSRQAISDKGFKIGDVVKNYKGQGTITNISKSGKLVIDGIKGAFSPHVTEKVSQAAKSGAAYLPLLGNLAAITGAGVAGYGTGRALGKTPLLTDKNVTYDDMMTKYFENLMTPKKKKQKSLAEYLPLMDRAVEHAENDATGNMGIRGYTPTNPDEDLRRSVRNNFNRWQGGEQPAPWINERPAKYVDFMRRRWAPLQSEGATNDPNNLNVNWAPNVRDYIQQHTEPQEYQRLRSLNFVKNNIQNNENYA